jgi:hypothetical protein
MNTQARIAANIPVANMVIRGTIISDNLIEVGGRGGSLTFLTPDARKYVDRLPLGDPSKLADLYSLSFEEILDYLEELGSKLDVERNEHMQYARSVSYQTSQMTPSVLDYLYRSFPARFRRNNVREVAELSIGVNYLEGWVRQKRLSGAWVDVRCIGARTLHIVAGNNPSISVGTVIRNAILRSDALIKAPSNDPFTALGIALTMHDMAPHHPLTKHLSVAYWRGGDVELEEKLYQPHNLEKIMAWGGFASVKHVTQYIQPGLELISMDPKRSASIVGPEALQSEHAMREAALRIASDIGGFNQTACTNARVIYVMSGTDEDGLAKLNELGSYVYEALMNLPASISTQSKSIDRDLKAHVEALRFQDEWYRVIGGDNDEGAIVVSQLGQPVDFATKLNDRVANLVPVDSFDDVVGAINSYTQTVGVYPESLKQALRDILPFHGAQRLVSLGYAISGSITGPADGIEPLRRLGKWVTDEISSPDSVTPPWQWE